MFYYGLESDRFTQLLTRFDFGSSEPRFDEKLFGINPRLSLLPAENIAFGNKVLVLEKHTGSWCFLEPREYDVFKSLEARQLDDVVAGVPESYRDEVPEFVARLYWRGLVAINGRRFIEPDVFESGPISHTGLLFIIVPTERCNLACRYCSAKSNPSRQERMNWETARRTIDLIIDYVPERATVEFAGGEVCLEPDLLQRIVTYGRQAAEKAGRELTFCAQSNGTLLNRKLLERLQDLDVRVGLSLDGDRISNDVTRVFPGNKGTHATITKTIALMHEMGCEHGTICVVSKGNYRRLDKVLAHYEELGETGIKLNPVTRSGRAKEQWDELALEPEEFLAFHKEYLDMILHGETSILDENTAIMLEILGTKVHPYRCMRSQCGAGREFMTFAPNGDVYPCCQTRVKEEFRLANVHDIQQLDDIWRNNRIVSKLAERRTRVIAECKECTYKRFCEAGCPVASYDYFARTDAPHPWCRYYEGMYEELFRRLSQGSRLVEIFCPHAEMYDNSFFAGDAA